MNGKKYELLQDQTIEWRGHTLYRICALRDFGSVHAGDVGGYIECEHNLSQDGNARVYDNAWVYGNAWVCDNAQVCSNAQVYGDALVYDNARVYGDAWVCGDADG